MSDTGLSSSITECTKAACSVLDDCSDSPLLDCELLLAHVLKKDRTYLRTWPETQLNNEQLIQFQSLIKQRAKGVPIAYILGQQAFWDLDLQVDSSTLIPRPETELLVEYALDLYSTEQKINVIDMGTGSGAIAISLAKHRPQWSITALDISADALAIAEKNRQRYQLDNLNFIQSNWFEKLDEQNNFDLIISNPPYIAERDPHLARGDLRFEPQSALVSGQDGLDDIRKLAEQAQSYLKADGRILFEHGYDQAPAIEAILKQHNYQNIKQKHDLNGHIRVSHAQNVSTF